MIIGKNFFITEMPKTGTTFLRSYFKQYKEVELTNHHETLNQNKRYNLLKFRNKIGIIRNPYDWYLSMWKWSCKNKRGSPIYSDLTSVRLKLKRLRISKRLIEYIKVQIVKDRNSLKKLFLDVNSKKNFNKFLDIMLSFKNRYLIGSEYSFVPHRNLGYMTYIFFCQNLLRSDYNIMYLSKYSLSKILDHNNKKLYTNIFFKTENLNKSLKYFLKKNKIKVKKFNNLEDNSTSKNFRSNYKYFFSKKNILLIEKKEDFIFQKFKYKKLSRNFSKFI